MMSIFWVQITPPPFFGISPYSYLILIVLLCVFVLADSKCLNLMQSPQQRTRTPFTLWAMFPLTAVCMSWMDFEKDLLIWVRGKMPFSFFVFTPFISRSARTFCAQLNVIFVCHAPLNLTLSSSYSVCINACTTITTIFFIRCMQSGWLDQCSPPGDREEDTKVNILLHHPQSNDFSKDQTLGSKQTSKDSSKDNCHTSLFSLESDIVIKARYYSFCWWRPKDVWSWFSWQYLICAYRDYIFFCLQVQWRRNPIQPNGHCVRQKDDIREKNCRAPDPAYWGEWQPKSWFECRVTCAFTFSLSSYTYEEHFECQISKWDHKFVQEMSRAVCFGVYPLIFLSSLTDHIC